MSANAEIIAELRRVLNERDQAREQLDLTKRELGRWVDREAKAVRERDDAVRRITEVGVMVATNGNLLAKDAYRRGAEAMREACTDCAMYAERSARFAERADRLQSERDEARAEVEHAYREGGALYEAKIAEREAFRSGAEAMREACAAALMADGLVLSRERAANVVRALPIPEEP